MGKKEKKPGFLIGNKVFSKLSPLQKKIILELSADSLSLMELSRKIKHNVYSIGKQLSILQFRTKYNPLLKKGISNPLVKKTKDGKTTYYIIPKK